MSFHTSREHFGSQQRLNTPFGTGVQTEMSQPGAHAEELQRRKAGRMSKKSPESAPGTGHCHTNYGADVRLCATDVRLCAPSDSVFLQSMLPLSTMCVCR